jgi:hypothetical protein
MPRTLFGLKSRLAPRTLSAVGLHADVVSLATVTRAGERARLSAFELRTRPAARAHHHLAQARRLPSVARERAGSAE